MCMVPNFGVNTKHDAASCMIGAANGTSTRTDQPASQRDAARRRRVGVARDRAPRKTPPSLFDADRARTGRSPGGRGYAGTSVSAVISCVVPTRIGGPQ